MVIKKVCVYHWNIDVVKISFILLTAKTWVDIYVFCFNDGTV